MKVKLYTLNFVLIAVFVVLNALSLRHGFLQQGRYNRITQRAGLIHALKPELVDIEERLWGIISVYDVKQGRKVDLNELRYNDKIKKMLGNIDSAASLTDNKQLSTQFNILARSVRSLSIRIDAIKDRMTTKRMDEESTELIFFNPRSNVMLSQSYVDELEALLEQIRFARKVIESNISKYDEIEMRVLSLETQAITKESRDWIFINGVSVLGAFILMSIFAFT